MRAIRLSIAICLVAALVACDSTGTTDPGTTSLGVRVINANTVPIDVLVDGTAASSSVAPGHVATIASSVGAHTIAFRETGSSATASVQVNASANALRTVAAVRSSGVLSATALDDTNAVVPSGATKVRVLHLAPNAGEITAMRTQPDYGTPVSWQFPFTYSAAISAMGNPYYQSTVGTWDVRAWRKPSEDGLGWSGTAAKVSLTLSSGEKRTVLVLDKDGGGITLTVIE